jgi:hypothetical protein
MTSVPPPVRDLFPVKLCPGCSAQLKEHELHGATYTLLHPATLLRLGLLISPSRGRLSAAEQDEARKLQRVLMVSYECSQGSDPEATFRLLDGGAGEAGER